MNMQTPTLKDYGTADAVAFLDGTGKDAAGRTVEDYLKFDADKWEECHNHIQWAFPSHIKSKFNPDAPVVDMDEFYKTISVQGLYNIGLLTYNYLTSLGFTQDESGKWHADLKHERVNVWISPCNHNYQRFSRLLNLLSLIEPDTAIQLLDELLTVASTIKDWTVRDHFNQLIPVITVETVVYWSKAAIGTL